MSHVGQPSGIYFAAATSSGTKICCKVASSHNLPSGVSNSLTRSTTTPSLRHIGLKLIPHGNHWSRQNSNLFGEPFFLPKEHDKCGTHEIAILVIFTLKHMGIKWIRVVMSLQPCFPNITRFESLMSWNPILPWDFRKHICNQFLQCIPLYLPCYSTSS